MANKWQGVCVHHSLTKDSKTSSWEAIRKYHIETNGWQEIGYHFGIEDVNGSVKLRIGRPTDQAGAHALGLNSTHLGICIIGNYDIIAPSEDYLVTLGLVIADLARFYKFPINTTTIKYHNEVSHKSCPGKLFPGKDVVIKYTKF